MSGEGADIPAVSEAIQEKPDNKAVTSTETPDTSAPAPPPPTHPPTSLPDSTPPPSSPPPTSSAPTSPPPTSPPPTPTSPPPTSPPPTSPPPASPKAASSTKIDVLLKPAGNAPILKKKKWTVDRQKHIGWISEFIRKFIRTETEDSVFVYVNQSFSPSPDTEIGTLFDCFGSDGKLVIYYCRTQAWG